MIICICMILHLADQMVEMTCVGLAVPHHLGMSQGCGDIPKSGQSLDLKSLEDPGSLTLDAKITCIKGRFAASLQVGNLVQSVSRPFSQADPPQVCFRARFFLFVA